MGKFLLVVIVAAAVVYLLVRVAQLHRAGRVHGPDEAVDRFAAMADLAVPPYNLTGF